LSKFTTQSLGTESRRALSSSSDTRSRFVRVSAATVTDPIRSATGSRVNTSTGRSPPGVAANQISPRRIVDASCPVGPIFRGPPISNHPEGELRIGRRNLLVAVGFTLASKRHEMTMKRLAEKLSLSGITPPTRLTPETGDDAVDEP
jgi:hypothetical protein